MTVVSRTRAVARMLAVTAFAIAVGCSSDGSPGPGARLRTYDMGFSDFPPAPDTMLARRAIQLRLPRADAAIMHLEIPWNALLAGASADSLVLADVMPLANAYRASGLAVVIETDVTNPIDRTAESPALVLAGHSLTEDTLQRVYRRYIVSLATVAAPIYLGLASETNLIRAAAPAGVYAALGGFADPSEVPDDYFARLAGERLPPVLVTEADGHPRTSARCTRRRRFRRRGSGGLPRCSTPRTPWRGSSSTSPTSISRRSGFHRTIHRWRRSPGSGSSTPRSRRSPRSRCGTVYSRSRCRKSCHASPQCSGPVPESRAAGLPASAHDSVGTSFGGASDLMYATSRQIIGGWSTPANAGIPFGRPSAIERKMSASLPP